MAWPFGPDYFVIKMKSTNRNQPPVHVGCDWHKKNIKITKQMNHCTWTIDRNERQCFVVIWQCFQSSAPMIILQRVHFFELLCQLLVFSHYSVSIFLSLHQDKNTLLFTSQVRSKFLSIFNWPETGGWWEDVRNNVFIVNSCISWHVTLWGQGAPHEIFTV